jgi:hypothetical protein
VAPTRTWGRQQRGTPAPHPLPLLTAATSSRLSPVTATTPLPASG